MEKVWEELKKIETEAQKIRSESEEKAKEILRLAEKEAETLVANSQTISQEEAERINKQATREANQKRANDLKEYASFLEEQRKEAEGRFFKVEKLILDATLGKTKI